MSDKNFLLIFDMPILNTIAILKWLNKSIFVSQNIHFLMQQFPKFFCSDQNERRKCWILLAKIFWAQVKTLIKTQ